MNNIKLIVSEVDGVVTDSMLTIDELSNIVLKNYNYKDFEFINELKKKYNFCFLSSINNINYNLFRKKNIPFYWAKTSKLNVLYSILNRYNCTANELLYIGSSITDINCLKLAEYSVCPFDSPYVVKKVVNNVLSITSGNGVISEVYDLLNSGRHI